MVWKATGWKGALLHAALGGGMFLGGMLFTTGTAQAANCGERIRREEVKLRRDIDHHGFYSRQARHDREKIAELRDSCRGNYRRGYGWRGDGDRDDRRWRDQDRDRDRERRDRDRDWRDRH